MRGRFFAELKTMRRHFAALGFLLLAVPLLINTLPRPSDAARQYIANLTGISICATDPGSIPVQGNPAPSSPCENSVGCAACPSVATASAVILEILAPATILSAVLAGRDEDGESYLFATAHPARAPPFFL